MRRRSDDLIVDPGMQAKEARMELRTPERRQLINEADTAMCKAWEQGFIVAPSESLVAGDVKRHQVSYFRIFALFCMRVDRDACIY